MRGRGRAGGGRGRGNYKEDTGRRKSAVAAVQTAEVEAVADHLRAPFRSPRQLLRPQGGSFAEAAGFRV